MTADDIAFIEDSIKKAKRLEGLSRSDQIGELCSEAGCSNGQARAHLRMYLRGWNAHPSERFKRWWQSVGYKEAEKETHHGWSAYSLEDNREYPINYVTAYNCQAVRDIYRLHLQAERIELRRIKGVRWHDPEVNPLDGEKGGFPDDSIEF